MKRFTAISATALAAVLALAGCGAGNETGSPAATTPAATTTMPGMDHGNMGASPSGAAAGHNSADAMFAQMMTPHHKQAVQMSEIMLTKEGLDPQITELAEDIKAAQGPEIEKMTGWLQAWGEPMEMSGGHAMEGMMSADDLAKLEAAQGCDAARMFLTQMIEHHEGAIAMAEEEVANGSNPDAVALAKQVVEDQEAEIGKMNTLLAAL